MIDFNKAQFILSGKVLEKKDYDKPISQFVSSLAPYNLVILVVNSSKITDISTLKNKNNPDNSNNQTNDNANTKSDNKTKNDNNNNLNSGLNILTNNIDKIPVKDNIPNHMDNSNNNIQNNNDNIQNNSKDDDNKNNQKDANNNTNIPDNENNINNIEISDIKVNSNFQKTDREPIKDDKIVLVIFKYKSKSKDFESTLKSEISQTCRNFANFYELDFNSLNFFINIKK